ncbi:pol protein [Cucumis melo var. makuwa]|uniref:Pol protein n=1 Tax=Cucumis melo var. makuwa TaxID=1194695 RepID=A0A5A7SQ35_CUCMM|nr:pol protein [Cucumis melo var. makuwa]
MLGPELVWSTNEAMSKIRTRMLTTHSRHKGYANVQGKNLKFDLGDMVFLKIEPMKGVMRFEKKEKLSPRFVESFEIFEWIGLIVHTQLFYVTHQFIHRRSSPIFLFTDVFSPPPSPSIMPTSKTRAIFCPCFTSPNYLHSVCILFDELEPSSHHSLYRLLVSVLSSLTIASPQPFEASSESVLPSFESVLPSQAASKPSPLPKSISLKLSRAVFSSSYLLLIYLFGLYPYGCPLGSPPFHRFMTV